MTVKLGSKEFSLRRTCGACINDDNCAFLYNTKGSEAGCVLRSVNETDKIHVDWIRESMLCPVPSHLGWITLSGLALYLVFFAPGKIGIPIRSTTPIDSHMYMISVYLNRILKTILYGCWLNRIANKLQPNQ